MSLTLGVVNNQALDDLIQSSSESEHKLKWVPHEEIVDIKPTRIDNIPLVNRILVKWSK